MFYLVITNECIKLADYVSWIIQWHMTFLLLFSVFHDYFCVMKAGNLNEALDILMSLEKQTRAVSNILCYPFLTPHLNYPLSSINRS